MALLEERSLGMLKKCEQFMSVLKLYDANYQANYALLTKLKVLSGKIEILDSLKIKNKDTINQLSELTDESANLQNDIALCEEFQNHLTENIPDVKPLTAPTHNFSISSFTNGIGSYNDMNYLNNTTSSVVSPIPESWKDLNSPVIPANKIKPANAFNDNNYMSHSVKQKEVANKSKPSLPSIMPFCENELKLVPAYLKGRLECSQINEVINAMNSVLEIKYSMIKKKFSQVKNTDKIIYNDWKEQEKYSPRGQYHITQSDLTSYGNISMCKRTINIITILSNSRKIKKEHMKNNVKYIIVSN